MASKKNASYFVLGLLYAPFLFMGCYYYYFIGCYFYALLISNQIFNFTFYFYYSWFILFLAVMGLICVIFPIWFYERSLK